MSSKSAPAWHVMLCGLVWMVLLVRPGAGNQMDPHVYPEEGPFFEGWYMRILDVPQNSSFGFLWGLVLPPTGVNSTLYVRSERTTSSADKPPPLCASILLSPKCACNLASPTGCFDPSDYTILKDGKPVEHDPDDKTPPQFEANIPGNLTFQVTPDGTHFSVHIGEHTLEGKTTSPVPWGPGGEGPEGWLENLPLPLHWFVYSLRSTVTWYSYSNAATGEEVSGGHTEATPVLAHLEKNWGKSFPEAWIWSEGVDPATKVSFSISGGLLREVGLDIPAQLSGYRNPGKGIQCSFNPSNSVHTLTHDGCAGTATLDVESLGCHVVFKLSAPPETFSECLVTPQTDGFRRGCLESYTAVADITVHKTLSGVSDHQVIPLVGLEFGGKFMCKGKCPK